MQSNERGKTIGCGTLLFLASITFLEVAGSLLCFGVAEEKFPNSQNAGFAFIILINIILGVWAYKFFKEKQTEISSNDSD